MNQEFPQPRNGNSALPLARTLTTDWSLPWTLKPGLNGKLGQNLLSPVLILRNLETWPQPQCHRLLPAFLGRGNLDF